MGILDLDARIPLSGQAPQQVPSPIATLGEAMRIKQTQQQMADEEQVRELNRQKLVKAQMDMADDEWLKTQIPHNLGPDGTPDWQAISRSALQAGKIPIALKAQTEHESMLDNLTKRQSAELTYQQKGLDLINSFARGSLSAFNDQDPALDDQTRAQHAQKLWQAGKAAATSYFGTKQPDGSTALPPALQNIPDQFDPNYAKGVQEWGLTAAQSLDYHKAALSDANEARIAAKEGRDATDHQQQAVANLLSAATGPEDLPKIAAAAKLYNTPKTVLDFFGIGDYYGGGQPPTPITPDQWKHIQAKAAPLRMSAKDVATDDARQARLDFAQQRLDLTSQRNEALNQAAISRLALAQKEFDARQNKPTADDPALPNAVRKDILRRLPTFKGDASGLTPHDQAVDWLEKEGAPAYVNDHPKFDPKKARAMIDSFHGASGSLPFDQYLPSGSETGAVAPPHAVTPPPVTAPPARAGGPPPVKAPDKAALRQKAKAALEQHHLPSNDAAIDRFLSSTANRRALGGS